MRSKDIFQLLIVEGLGGTFSALCVAAGTMPVAHGPTESVGLREALCGDPVIHRAHRNSNKDVQMNCKILRYLFLRCCICGGDLEYDWVFGPFGHSTAAVAPEERGTYVKISVSPEQSHHAGNQRVKSVGTICSL